MDLIDVKCFIFITGFLLSGTLSKEQKCSKSNTVNSEKLTPLKNTAEENSRMPIRILFRDTKMEPLEAMANIVVATSIAGVPVFNPSNLTSTTIPAYNSIPTTNPITPMITPSTPIITPGNPYTAPGMGAPILSSGQSWCIARQTASQTALQVALDYACGYGDADCLEIQPGASCYSPDTVRDHASYAFNSYYQKNLIPTSCDFGGTAIITNVNPSTSTCQYPSTSMSSSSFNTTTPTGSSIYGSVPPDSTSRAHILRTIHFFMTLACFLILMQ